MSDIPQFLCCNKYLKDNERNSLHWNENMSDIDLMLDIICSSKLTIFLKLCSGKTVLFSEQIMFADKYPGICSCQMGAVVYVHARYH